MAPFCITLGGTLIVIIPTRDGVVVASDSLASVGGVSVPNRGKLHTVPGSARTVFTITGTATFVSPPPSTTDLVTWVQRAEPMFSGDEIVGGVLSQTGDTDVTEPLLHLVGESLVKGFTAFFQRSQDVQRIFAGEDICLPLIVQFDAKIGHTKIARLVIRANSEGEPLTAQHTIDDIAPNDPRYIGTFGETDYVNENVLRPGSVGWPHLGPGFLELWNGPTLAREMIPENAAKIAARVIHATEEASRVVPIKTAVGGKPVVMLVNGKDPPRLIE